MILTSTAPLYSCQGKYYHLHFTDEKNKPQGKSVIKLSSSRQLGLPPVKNKSGNHTGAGNPAATSGLTPDDDGPRRPNQCTRGTVCSNGTAVSLWNVTHGPYEKQTSGLWLHQHPALRNQATLSLNKTPFVIKYRANVLKNKVNVRLPLLFLRQISHALNLRHKHYSP